MIDIEERLGFDERCAVDFVLDLRKQWAGTLYPALVDQYRAGGPAVPAADVARAVHELPAYPWFSHLERAQQKMLWRIAAQAVIDRRDLLERDAPESADDQAAGALELDQQATLPAWYRDVDIHLQPGSYFAGELSAYVYELGARIVMLRDNDGYKFHRLFIDTALPDRPEATCVLDLGCGFGKSTLPLAAKYPGARIIGLDLAAPGLRLAHGRAREAGIAVEFRQGDARRTGLPSESCDVVTGTMLLHEMPADAITGTISEASRLLKPGGALHFLEFQLTGDPVRDTTIVEHAERNNEPYFRDLFGADLTAIAERAGLADASWTPFDERSAGLAPGGWGERCEWHFPWAVFSAAKPAPAAV